MDIRALPLTQERIKGRSVVDPTTGCWNWEGNLHRQGYGVIRSNRVHHLAHRASYAVFKSDIPEGMFVCHKCDNRQCVNPDHLFLGTAQDNQRDMAKKNRSTYGEKSSSAKLTEADVIKILALKDSGKTQKEIADLFGVSRALISMIFSGKVWVRAVEGVA